VGGDPSARGISAGNRVRPIVGPLSLPKSVGPPSAHLISFSILPRSSWYPRLHRRKAFSSQPICWTSVLFCHIKIAMSHRPASLMVLWTFVSQRRSSLPDRSLAHLGNDSYMMCKPLHVHTEVSSLAFGKCRTESDSGSEGLFQHSHGKSIQRNSRRTTQT